MTHGSCTLSLDTNTRPTNGEQMLLHRFALMQFDSRLPSVQAWSYRSADNVTVGMSSVNNVDDRPKQDGVTFILQRPVPEEEPTSILLAASTRVTVAVVEPNQVGLPEAPRIAAERALSEMASMISIQSESMWKLFSPRPYIALVSESDVEQRLLDSTKRVILPRNGGFARPMHGQGIGPGPFPIEQLLRDRRDGVMLLGSAVRVGGGVAQLHELFRVLENGFGRAGVGLIEPLTSFLQSYPEWDLQYTRTEVETWVNRLRHPATHADLSRSRRVAYDSDVERYLHRIEQAAYDVLFNKAHWNSRDTDRVTRWVFSTAEQADGNQLVDPRTGNLRAGSVLDHFGAFPLAEGIRVLPPELHGGAAFLLADWYFPEEQWREFGIDEIGS